MERKEEGKAESPANRGTRSKKTPVKEGIKLAIRNQLAEESEEEVPESNESFELELSGIGTSSDSSRAHSPSA
jgi:hypothetical protein